MANQIGRLGYLGLAIEAVAGTPEASPDVYLNLNDAPKFNEKHESIANIGLVHSRIERADSVQGKKWMEGTLNVNLDTIKCGYLFKLALGNEISNGAGRHDFYPTVSGNNLLSATLFQNRGGNIFETIPYCVVDQLNLTAGDGLITLQATCKSKVSDNSSQLTPTTTSGQTFTFANYTVKFGATLAAAEVSTAIKMNSFNLVIANNVQLHHQSGSQEFSIVTSKQLKVTGSYTKLFDNATERNAFMGLTKRSMVVDFTIPGSNETIKINIPKFALQEHTIDGGISDIYAETGSFEAEIDTTQMAHYLTIIVTNSKTTEYA